MLSEQIRLSEYNLGTYSVGLWQLWWYDRLSGEVQRDYISSLFCLVESSSLLDPSAQDAADCVMPW